MPSIHPMSFSGPVDSDGIEYFQQQPEGLPEYHQLYDQENQIIYSRYPNGLEVVIHILPSEQEPRCILISRIFSRVRSIIYPCFSGMRRIASQAFRAPNRNSIEGR